MAVFNPELKIGATEPIIRTSAVQPEVKPPQQPSAALESVATGPAIKTLVPEREAIQKSLKILQESVQNLSKSIPVQQPQPAGIIEQTPEQIAKAKEDAAKIEAEKTGIAKIPEVKTTPEEQKIKDDALAADKVISDKILELDTLRSRQNTANQSVIDSIKAQFNIRKREMENINKKTLAQVRQVGFSLGLEQFTPVTAANIIGAEEKAGLERLSALDAQEISLIAQAQQASSEQDFGSLYKQIQLLQNTRKEKQDALEKQQTLAKENTEALTKQIEAATKNYEAKQKTLNDNISAVASYANRAVVGLPDAKNQSEKIEEIAKSFGYDPRILLGKMSELSQKYPPGIIGEYQYAKDQGYTGNFTKYQNEDQNRKATMAANLSNELLTAYAQQYASTGQIPIGAPKGSFGEIAQMAKDLPRPDGMLIDINTGTRPNKLTEAQQTGIISAYDAIKKLDELKELDKLRIKGIVSGTFGKFFGSDAQQRYVDLKEEIIMAIRQARSGQAFSAKEAAEYEDKLPGRVGQIWFLGVDPQVRIENLKNSMRGSMEARLAVTGSEITGYLTREEERAELKSAAKYD